jgi:hypothetical protein
MNYTSFIVKILENPKQKFFEKTIFVTEMRVRYIPIGKKTLNTKDFFQVSIWKTINSPDCANFYKKDDYIFIEGWISLRPSRSKDTEFKEVEMIVFKDYLIL